MPPGLEFVCCSMDGGVGNILVRSSFLIMPNVFTLLLLTLFINVLRVEKGLLNAILSRLVSCSESSMSGWQLIDLFDPGGVLSTI
jgi:hypothetical protein